MKKRDDFTTYATESLYYLPSVLTNTTSLGLYEGTLHDVLDDNAATSTAAANATGFNVTCAYLPDAKVKFYGADEEWLWWGVSSHGVQFKDFLMFTATREE